jgi:hypothetical protein
MENQQWTTTKNMIPAKNTTKNTTKNMIQEKSTTKNRTQARGITKGKTTAQNISKIIRPRERERIDTKSQSSGYVVGFAGGSSTY